jgi:hypothetical protein
MNLSQMIKGLFVVVASICSGVVCAQEYTGCWKESDQSMCSRDGFVPVLCSATCTINEETSQFVCLGSSYSKKLNSAEPLRMLVPETDLTNGRPSWDLDYIERECMIWGTCECDWVFNEEDYPHDYYYGCVDRYSLADTWYRWELLPGNCAEFLEGQNGAGGVNGVE